MSVTNAIRELLNSQNIPFRELHHEPTFTSEESAKARGEALSNGAKAILLKTDEKFGLFVIPADGKLDSTAIKRHLGLKKLRFATPEELFEVTGLVPGSVPPFGRPVLPVELYADPAVGARTGRVAFNAGSVTTSIVLNAKDWVNLAAPVEFRFCSW